MVDDQRWQAFCEKREKIALEMQRFKETVVRPTDISTQESEAVFDGALSREYRLHELLRRPNVTYNALVSLNCVGDAVEDKSVAEQVEIQYKYAGYIERQQKEINKQRRHEETLLPDGLDYKTVRGLSNEALQKLSEQRPVSIGQASRISGITPATISLLLVHLKKHSSLLNALH